MSHWNYRLVKHTEDENVWYAFHEAYYDKDDDENPHSITEMPAGIIEEELKNIEWVLKEMLKATKKPILNFEDF